MEPRQLFAIGIEYDAPSKALKLIGTTGDDMAEVNVRAGAVVAEVSDAAGRRVSKTFAPADVALIKFDGQGGQDLFTNRTTIKSVTWTEKSGIINTNMLTGTPGNTNPEQDQTIGVFTVGSTGKVQVDYLYKGAGYRGQLGFYSLEGMEKLRPGSTEYKAEAARRVLAGGGLGGIAISATVEGARFSAKLPWEGNLNTLKYKGVRTLSMTPGSTFAAMLVPNGLISEVAANPSISGAKLPLFSIPSANPYPQTPQMRAQLGDLDGSGSVFAMEDLRLDQTSDRDYNDMVFQVLGARGVAPQVSEVTNVNRNFATTTLGTGLLKHTQAQQVKDREAVNGSYSFGTFTVGASGVMDFDFVFRGGKHDGEMAVFSLQGMGKYAPGSAEFIKEAARRALTQSTLGQVVVNLYQDAARETASLAWEPDYNKGTYRGVQKLKLTPRDTVAFMLVPNGTVWSVYAGGKSAARPVFSVPEANPTEGGGSRYMLDLTGSGTRFGFEDQLFDRGSDKDHNDVVFRIGNAKAWAPTFGTWVNPAKDIRKQAVWSKLLVTA